MGKLTELISRLVANPEPIAGTEEATRQGAILPILAELGWDWQNIDEVVPEYGAGTGRVDYCLRTGARSVVFIEVKRAGVDLQPHQPQLLRYAFEEGVDLAALTDGFLWWLYLPTASGSWEQRKYFSLDMRRVPPERSSEVLRSFLGRDAVVSGQASERARAEFASQERARRVHDAFPVAWQQLVAGPDDLLAELVTQAVAGIAGHAPDAEDVAQFLSSLAADARVRSRPTERSVRAARTQRPPAVDENYTGLTPRAIELDGSRLEVRTWRDILTAVCDYLASTRPDFEERALQMRGRTRSLFSRDRDELYGPLPVHGTSLFVEGNLSANNIVQFCRRLLAAMDRSPEALRVEVDPSTPRRRRRISSNDGAG